jgi:hypothetical protein
MRIQINEVEKKEISEMEVPFLIKNKNEIFTCFKTSRSDVESLFLDVLNLKTGEISRKVNSNYFGLFEGSLTLSNNL